MTRNVDQIKGATIYSRSVSEDFRDAIIREPHILQFINFSSLTVKQKGIFTRTLSIKITLVIVNKVTDKLLHTFMLIRLIISFDRGREYY